MVAVRTSPESLVEGLPKYSAFHHVVGEQPSIRCGALTVVNHESTLTVVCKDIGDVPDNPGCSGRVMNDTPRPNEIKLGSTKLKMLRITQQDRSLQSFLG